VAPFSVHKCFSETECGRSCKVARLRCYARNLKKRACFQTTEVPSMQRVYSSFAVDERGVPLLSHRHRCRAIVSTVHRTTDSSDDRVARATHESTSGGAWLLGIFLSAIPCWIMFLNVVPPWLKQGHAQPRITLVSSWLSVALTVFLVEFMGFGALYVFFGSSRRELLEHLAMLSMPLAWISPNFLITPSRTFFDLCGIILGNSAFFGPLMFACYQTVRWAFRRSRPTQLSLSISNPTADDE
jgi:hypothetical protein